MNTVLLGSLLCAAAIAVSANTSLAANIAEKKNCLVLADGYLSEYAWGNYQEMTFHADHPGHDACVRGLLDYHGRFHKMLTGWNVRRIDLEQLQGALDLRGIDLVILDDVRQSICDPYEAALVEFVRKGGGLLVYGGRWGLGSCPKTEHSVLKEISSYEKTPLGEILPVKIVKTPDWEKLGAKNQSSRTVVFRDKALARGIDTDNWQITALHACEPRGQVLAELDGKPLVASIRYGRGTVVVYTGDDLGWVVQGLWSAKDLDFYRSKFSGTLWRRMAAMAAGDKKSIPPIPDPEIKWEKGPAYAHPDQPINFQWGGFFYFKSPDMLKYWAKDLIEHSTNLYYGIPGEIGKEGVQGWASIGVPLFQGGTLDDPETWMVGADGKTIEKTPCYNNPKALATMASAVESWAFEKKEQMPWVTYGHMGDETEWKSCYCQYCKSAFKEKYGSELPELKKDFTDNYLKQWIDYQLFKNESIGKMYARASEAAKRGNPGIKMFASLPIVGGMCHGDDQFHTQSGFDILWDHTYPGTMAIRVGLNAQILEETAYLQGRPHAPILNLLQGFDSYDRYPNVPPAEYMREMTWQAIAHGIDSIGWFVYNAWHWILPGTEAWDECKRLADDVLAPLTPTLYEMMNTKQPIGLLQCYSQEAVDGLKEKTYDKEDPWNSVIRWWSTHATQEAYEVFKYAQIPFNVVSEHRFFEGEELPWKVVVIPYVEYLHPSTYAALEKFIANGGKVYVGANSTLEMDGIQKLPVSFDTKFSTWWPKNRPSEWNQRRARNYMISAFLVKAEQVGKVFAGYKNNAVINIEDPEVVYSLREAGDAKYLFFINDHQNNPASPELRKKRLQYNHFMLMPMEFPNAKTTAKITAEGYLYPLLATNTPIKLSSSKPMDLDISLDGGDGQIYLLLPEAITAVKITAEPKRLADGVQIEAAVFCANGQIKASVPLQIDITDGSTKQTVYATTKAGALSWKVPYLKEFSDSALTITVTDLASGKSVKSKTY